MYLKTSLLILFGAFLHAEVNAQFIESKTSVLNEQQISFSFNPQIVQSNTLKLNVHKASANNLLVSTGFLLQGLKFNSPVDQFNASLPFDFRAYEPRTFSELNQKVSSNLLLRTNRINFTP